MTRPSGPYHRAFRRVKTNSPPKPLLKRPSSGCPLCKDWLGSLRALSLSMIVSFPPDANYFFNRLRWPHSHLCLGISVLAYFQYISLLVIVTFLNEAETLNFLISVSKTLMFGAWQHSMNLRERKVEFWWSFSAPIYFLSRLLALLSHFLQWINFPLNPCCSL